MRIDRLTNGGGGQSVSTGTSIDGGVLRGARILVTGATGFVGIHLSRVLAELGGEVHALVRRPPDDASLAFLAPLAGRIRWVEGDVTDREGMVACVSDGVTDVVHAAAITATPEQERAATARVFEVNAGGTLNLLEAARIARIRRFVLVSSGGLYGPAPPTPALDESTPMRAGNLYGIAKAASEGLVLRYARLHGFAAAIGRLGTTYGPMERTTGSRTNLSAVRNAIDAMRTAGAGGEVRVRGAHVARDFIHVDDAVDAFARLLAADELGHDVYNVGSPVAYPLSDALDALAQAAGASWTDVAADDDGQVDVIQTSANARAAMDTSRLERDLGWSARFDLASGARATFAWYERHGEDLEEA